MIAQMTAKNGIRWSSARAFLRPAQDRPNLHILLNTTATKVLVHPKSKNAQGIEIQDAYGHSMRILAKKEVIVAGGAVNSPQILMLSGIGPKDELTKVTLMRRELIDFICFNIHNMDIYFYIQILGGRTSDCRFTWRWQKST